MSRFGRILLLSLTADGVLSISLVNNKGLSVFSDNRLLSPLLVVALLHTTLATGSMDNMVTCFASLTWATDCDVLRVLANFQISVSANIVSLNVCPLRIHRFSL